MHFAHKQGLSESDKNDRNSFVLCGECICDLFLGRLRLCTVRLRFPLNVENNAVVVGVVGSISVLYSSDQ